MEDETTVADISNISVQTSENPTSRAFLVTDNDNSGDVYSFNWGGATSFFTIDGPNYISNAGTSDIYQFSVQENHSLIIEKDIILDIVPNSDVKKNTRMQQ